MKNSFVGKSLNPVFEKLQLLLLPVWYLGVRSASVELPVSSLHQDVYSFDVPILKPQNILCVLCWAVWDAGKLEVWLISLMVKYVIIISILFFPWNICIQGTLKKTCYRLGGVQWGQRVISIYLGISKYLRMTFTKNWTLKKWLGQKSLEGGPVSEAVLVFSWNSPFSSKVIAFNSF